MQNEDAATEVTSNMVEQAAGRAHRQPSRITTSELNAMMTEFGPFVRLYDFQVEEIAHSYARIRLPYRDDHVRPGGTIAGPAMMALADYALYVAILAAIGPVTLAVTTNLSINFLRKPADADLFCDARLIKLGKRLAVGEMGIHAVGDDDLCAHATATYSIPPDR